MTFFQSFDVLLFQLFIYYFFSFSSLLPSSLTWSDLVLHLAGRLFHFLPFSWYSLSLSRSTHHLVLRFLFCFYYAYSNFSPNLLLWFFFLAPLFLFPLSLRKCMRMKKNYKKLAMFNSGLELYFYSKWLNFTRNASLSWNRPEFGIAWGSLALVCPLVQNILAIPEKMERNSKHCSHVSLWPPPWICDQKFSI